MTGSEVRYVNSGGVHIAYRVFGDGPLDLVLVPAFTSHLEQNHEWPGLVRWNQRLASFSRLVVFDKRGTGLSDYAPGPVVLEGTMQDVLAVLDSWERFKAERSLAQRVAGAVTDDPDTLECYFGYARQGRSALWVHVPDDTDAKRAVRALADHQVLHLRHYGHDSQQDIHIR